MKTPGRFSPEMQGCPGTTGSMARGYGRVLKASQPGFSLVELMIAITIGLIILLAITVMFSRITQGFRTTDDSSRAMENGNFALRVLGDDLRMVGFVGLSNDAGRIEPAKSGVMATADSANCGVSNPNWPYPQGNPGIEHIPATGTLPCIPGKDANSPILVFRHATGMFTADDDPFLAGGDLEKSNNLFLQSGPVGGIIFRGKDYLSEVKNADRGITVCRSKNSKVVNDARASPPGAFPLPCDTDKNDPTRQPPAPIFEYAAYVYYIRPCSRPAGAVCAATDDGGDPLPTLVRLQLDGNDPLSFVETPIAEGVERLAVQFIDRDGNPLKEADAEQAVTARLSVLIRSKKMDRQTNTSTTDDSRFTYALADGTSFNCGAVGTPACAYRRQLYTDTLVLKNYAFR